MTGTAAQRAQSILDSAPAAPYPGGGATGARWQTLRDLCHVDIAVGRLVEAHLDADAILHELAGCGTAPEQFWGVWAAEPPHPRVTAVCGADGGWTLSGAKPWCSGVVSCTHALITADVDAGSARRLFAVALDAAGVRRELTDWTTTGMERTETGTVILDNVAAEPIGAPGAYLDRPGFWHGGIGVAACWAGGAHKVADVLYAAVADTTRAPSDILLMHLGAVEAHLASAVALLDDTARAVDGAPHDAELARRRALIVRWSVEQVAGAVIDRVNRALGPGPLVHDAEHAQAVADLQVYVRQSHADSDLVALGKAVSEDTQTAFR